MVAELSSIAEESLRISLCQPGTASFVDGAVTDWRICPFLVVAQSYEGRYEVKFRGQVSRITEPGGAFLVGAEAQHHIIHRADPGRVMRARWIHVRFSLFGAIDLSSLLDIPLIIEPAIGRRFEAVILELIALLSRDDSALARLAARNRLAFQALELVAGISTFKPGGADTVLELGRLSPVLQFINDHLADPLSVAGLARVMGLSVPRFHSVFKGAMHMSPKEYVLSCRLSEARMRLSGTDTPIQDVAVEAGFPDPFHFSRLFKARFRMSPSEYRARHRVESE
ncbi:MAG: helix-turn-helix transcriptional regulator [Planctomycetes bacterium]|nr:helix-turn-helix transcriptional regulator [Planctomycetota bacterium]